MICCLDKLYIYNSCERNLSIFNRYKQYLHKNSTLRNIMVKLCHNIKFKSDVTLNIDIFHKISISF